MDFWKSIIFQDFGKSKLNKRNFSLPNLGIQKRIYTSPIQVDSDRPNVRFGRTVWPNCLAELLGRTSTVRFGTNDRTFFLQNTELFFVLHSMPMASFHIFVLLNDPHVRGVIIDLQGKQPKECQQSQNWNKTIILT